MSENCVFIAIMCCTHSHDFLFLISDATCQCNKTHNKVFMTTTNQNVRRQNQSKPNAMTMTVLVKNQVRQKTMLLNSKVNRNK